MNSTLKKFIVKIIARKINAIENPIVFGCNSTFFYRLIPKLDNHVRVFDLIHAFSENGTEKYSLSVVPQIHKRIVLGKKGFQDFVELYNSHNISSKYLDRIEIIGNKVPIPIAYTSKTDSQFIKTLFVARNSPEKRFELFIRIARKCLQKGFGVQFFIIGDYDETLDIPKNVTLLGVLKERDTINNWYKISELLLITSSSEGFPMTIMEGMSYGVVPITTSVGEIPSVLNSSETNIGIVIENSNKEEEIIENFIISIKKFVDNRQLLSRYSKNAYNFAKMNFGEDRFNRKYRNLFDL